MPTILTGVKSESNDAPPVLRATPHQNRARDPSQPPPPTPNNDRQPDRRIAWPPMQRRWTCLAATVIACLGALAAATAAPAAAQTDPEPSAAQRCFEHHQFGAQPVDVAKSADGQTVLAQVSWGYHDAIGCYLTLDDTALAALRAAPAPQSLPDAETEASKQCFQHHQFGQRPVDVAKTADRQTVLARLSWGYHDAIGC